MGTLRANICSSVTVAHIMVLLFCQFMIDYARYFPPCCIQFLFVRLSLTWVTARHLSWLLINMAWQTDPASYVGWVCCWFTLFREVFLRVLRFSPLLKNQHFQIPIRSGLLSSTLSWASGSCDRASTALCLALIFYIYIYIVHTVESRFLISLTVIDKLNESNFARASVCIFDHLFVWLLGMCLSVFF